MRFKTSLFFTIFLLLCIGFLSTASAQSWYVNWENTTWDQVMMNDNGTGGDDTAGDGIYSVEYNIATPNGSGQYYEFKITDQTNYHPSSNVRIEVTGSGDDVLFTFDTNMYDDNKYPMTNVVNSSHVVRPTASLDWVVVGDFQGWDPVNGLQLTDDNGDDVWTATTTIASAGDHVFKYTADYEWGTHEFNTDGWGVGFPGTDIPFTTVEDNTEVTFYLNNNTGRGWVELPQLPAMVQIIHNSADPAAESVDIYVNDGLLDELTDLSFREATPFLEVPSGEELTIDIRPAGADPSSTPVYTEVLGPLASAGTYVVIANGVLDDAGWEPNPIPDTDIEFGLFVLPDAQMVATDPTNVDFTIFHGITDAPPLDIYDAADDSQLYDDMNYGDFTSYISVPAGEYTLYAALFNDPTPVYTYDIDVTDTAGQSAVLFASGVAQPNDNNWAPWGHIFGALPDGTVFQLVRHVSPGVTTHNDPSCLSVAQGIHVKTTAALTVTNQLGSGGPAYMQMDDAGLAAYGIWDYDIAIGDTIEITGELSHFNGLQQISPIFDITVLSTDNPDPAPYPIELSEINEDLEGLLVSIDEVYLVDPNDWPVDPAGGSGINIDIYTAAGDTAEMRIDTSTDLNGSPQPVEPFTLVAALGQYDSSDDPCDGYQLLPRFYTDIIQPVDYCPAENLAANLTAGGMGVFVTWDAPSGSNCPTVENYTIFRNEDGGDFTEVATTSGADVLSYEDMDVTEDSEYCYYVVTNYTDGGMSDASNTDCATPEELCAPENLMATASASDVTVTWDEPDCGGGGDIVELIYDDGTNTGAYSYNGNTMASRMSPDGPCQVLTLKYFTTTEAGDNTFNAEVYGWTGSQPGTDLLHTETATAVDEDWLEVDVADANLTFDDDFMVGFGSINTTTYMGYNANDNNGRSWDLVGGSWSQWSETYLIRAIVQYTTTGQIVELEPVVVNYETPMTTTEKISIPASPKLNRASQTANATTLDDNDDAVRATLTGYTLIRTETSSGDQVTFDVGMDVTEYVDTDVEVDLEYCYTAIAVYEEGMSEDSNEDCATVGGGPVLCPPQNLEAAAASGGVELNWEAPADDCTTGWIHWDTGVIGNSIGFGDGVEATFTVAARFAAEDVATYVGNYITKLQIVCGEPAENASYTLKVWEGGSYGDPGTEILSQSISGWNVDDWTEYTLDTAIEIQPGMEYWLGYETSQVTGYPAGCDDGPTVEGKGLWIYDTEWYELQQAVPGLPYNWNIRGGVTATPDGGPMSFIGEMEPITSNRPIARVDNTDQPTLHANPDRDLRVLVDDGHSRELRELAGYAIYRSEEGGDYSEIGTVDDPATLTYLDEDVTGNTEYCYKVSALYDEGESGFSNEDCALALIFGTEYLVWAPFDTDAGDAIAAAIEANNGTVFNSPDLVPYIDEGVLNDFMGVFVCLGMSDDPGHYVIQNGDPEGPALQSYLTSGNGNLFIEGGDTWVWDIDSNNGFDFRGIFGISSGSDGASGDDMTDVEGVDFTFTHGFSSAYSGPNEWVDEIEPASPGEFNGRIFTNPNDGMGCGVAYNPTGADIYHTIGTSFRFAGIESQYHNDLMADMLEFFDTGTLDVEDEVAVPLAFSLEHNYPNPFNPSTAIQFALPKSSHVKMTVYNSAGQLVRTLIDKDMSAAHHTVRWDGTNDGGQSVSSGVYFYRIEADSYDNTKRMMLLK